MGVTEENYLRGVQEAGSDGSVRFTSIYPAAYSGQVYATGGYEQSVRNLSQTSLDTDNVFSDGYSLQLATVTGSVAGGLTATLTVPV
jgi:protocatechuate 3,4-dioxygenase beta subunit